MSDIITEDKIPTVRLGNLVYRLPFHDLLRPLTAKERDRMKKSIQRYRVQYPILVYKSLKFGDRCVIDGANRVAICAELGFDLGVTHRGLMSDEDARDKALEVNLTRRHLSIADQKRLRDERIQRAMEMSAGGASLREIARAENVSLGQVQKDLEKGQSVYPYTLKPLSLFRKSLTALFRTGSEGPCGAVPELLAGPHRAAVERACQRREIPVEGDRLPWIDALVAMIGDVAAEVKGHE